MQLYPPRCNPTIRIFAILLGTVLLLLQPSFGLPSEELYTRSEEIFDMWAICRTRAYGDDGFFRAAQEGFWPGIVYESLGQQREEAYRLGSQFVENIDNQNQLAEAIFRYVRNGMTYTADQDQFGYRDFAQNADELIRNYEQGRQARGDCEDYAILLAVMWKGAGLRSAIVLAPQHAAAMVYLPDYHSANMVWELDGEKGWIWAEATGSTNPLGWTPDRYLSEKLMAYEVVDNPNQNLDLPDEPPGNPTDMPNAGGWNIAGFSPFILTVIVLWVLSSIGRRS